jgi:hypothetical protein
VWDTPRAFGSGVRRNPGSEFVAHWPRRPTPIVEVVPAPKTLRDHCIDGSFRSRRHHEQLAGPVVPWPELSAIQSRYVAASHELERRAIGVEFEHAARAFANDSSSTSAYDAEAELQALFDLPLVPIELAHSPRLYLRYWRAMRAGKLFDAGGTVAAIAVAEEISPATVRRDLHWLERFDEPRRL